MARTSSNVVVSTEDSDVDTEEEKEKEKAREKAKHEKEMEEYREKEIRESSSPDRLVQPEELVVEGDGWQDLMPDLVKMRSITKEEQVIGESYAEMHHIVVCSYDVSALGYTDSGPLQSYSHVLIKVGENEAMPALELSLRHMRENETCETACNSRFGHGPHGCKSIPGQDKDIPPDCQLLLRITLHENLGDDAVHFGDRAPDPEELWNYSSRIISLRKATGNDYFKRRMFEKAIRAYAAGVTTFEKIKVDELPHEEITKKFTDLFVDLASNLAACQIELKDGPKAMQICTDGLTFAPDHLKLNFRAAKAAFLMAEYKECERWLRDAQKLAPDDVACKQLEAQLKRAKIKHAADSKKLASKLVSKVDWSETPPEPTRLQKITAHMAPYFRGFFIGAIVVLIMAILMVFANF